MIAQSKALLLLALSGLALMCHATNPDPSDGSVQLSSSGKPLVKRPPGTMYSTVMHVDGGATRGIVAAIVIIELEQAIKRYLLAHPQLLPAGFSIARLEDFDINLADYFDCITGVSSGVWPALYLTSRGGQGASRTVLDNPEIVKIYGVVHTGGAEGLRILFKEFSSVIYPLQTIDLSAGALFDVTNPMSPGVAEPLYSVEGLEQTLGAFFGEATLADCDTSVIAPTLDLATSETLLFVQNAFRTTPVTSTARMVARIEPRPFVNRTMPFAPDLKFDEGKNYYLTDIGIAAGVPPALQPARNITQVGSDVVEFTLADQIGITHFALVGSFFTASETQKFNLEHVALLDLGTGTIPVDRRPLANEGLGEWFANLDLVSVLTATSSRTLISLTDYAFYSNPASRPFQYLRVQTEGEPNSEDALALSSTIIPALVGAQEQVGIALAAEYRESIDIFVEDFVFGQK